MSRKESDVADRSVKEMDVCDSAALSVVAPIKRLLYRCERQSLCSGLFSQERDDALQNSWKIFQEHGVGSIRYDGQLTVRYHVVRGYDSRKMSVLISLASQHQNRTFD